MVPVNVYAYAVLSTPQILGFTSDYILVFLRGTPQNLTRLYAYASGSPDEPCKLTSRTEKSMNNARKATTNIEKHRKKQCKSEEKTRKNHRKTEGNARKFLKTMENWWNALENHRELCKMKEKRWKN